METNWKILNLKREVDNGLVIEVTYVMNFKLQGESDRKIGLIKLEGDENDPNFIPFEELTEEIVLDWVKSELGQEEIDNIKTQYQTRLEERVYKKLNPEYLDGLPWDGNSLN